jgi:hypothetical protein
MNKLLLSDKAKTRFASIRSIGKRILLVLVICGLLEKGIKSK